MQGLDLAVNLSRSMRDREFIPKNEGLHTGKAHCIPLHFHCWIGRKSLPSLTGRCVQIVFTMDGFADWRPASLHEIALHC